MTPPTSKDRSLYTKREYPCGCSAEGPGDVPPYCPEHEPRKEKSPSELKADDALRIADRHEYLRTLKETP